MVLINIWHPKGGTGKTTVAASLAIALSRSWGRALYVEVGPVPVGVKLLGVEPDGKVHEGRRLAVYLEDESQLSSQLKRASSDVVVVIRRRSAPLKTRRALGVVAEAAWGRPPRRDGLARVSN